MMKDKPQTKAQLLSAAAEIWGYRFSESAIKIYVAALSSITADQLSAALSYGLQHGIWEYFPKPFQILELFEARPQNDLKVMAKTEFEEILKGIRSGRRSGFQISEAAERALNAVGGAEKVNYTPPEKMDFVRKDFEENYALFKEQTEIGLRRAALGMGPSAQQKQLEALTQKIGIGKALPGRGET
jgi:hypothetical protein